MKNLIVVYLLLVNLIGFMLFGIDKRKAVKNKYRIPEATLMMVSLIGGSAGCLLGMKTFHHKTLHPKFSIGIPVIIALQLALAIYLIFIR